MKNITISVSDEAYRRARITAAEKGTSVSALVAEFLEQLCAKDAEFARLEALQHETMKTVPAGFSAADRLSREELYDRAVR